MYYTVLLKVEMCALCVSSDENVQELAVELVQLGFISEVRGFWFCSRCNAPSYNEM